MLDRQAPLLDIDDVVRRFGGGRTLFGVDKLAVHAVQGVSLEVRQGETLGIVGESGCGKSTLARLLCGLDEPTAGAIRFKGESLDSASRGKGGLARRIQYVFQDPVASLNPRKTIRNILEAPLIHLLGMKRDARAARLAELMDAVNLRADFLDRYPHEFSGGQAQRIGIARALAAEPELIVLDEPVSALDVSVQAQVLNILDDLKTRFSLTYVFISHDLSVVESVSDRVAVMYFGRIAELGPAEDIFRQPRHHYTRLLLASAPVPGRVLSVADTGTDELPDPYDPPAGCAFHARCPAAKADCRQSQPPLEPAPGSPSHVAACFHPASMSGEVRKG
ncbi:ATP-binding cassette domain-containing protein [Nitratireductor mangrovi]|uniref:ATP-binding cassette domain-containing protein n=1 Tax=Nitratireductor mangrovi TaxID=2599600 RepID=A0A5B8KXX5_9HYPH|nr:oligopeptide/dipeptide ABC transporter ATP-binding protein [Nitratireductor mangrovi]QDZ00338.1 ATP-binding cassette domain-containing protein [Nitratireductor mangrovi]